MRREAASPLVPAGKRQRRTFAKIPEILEVPNLIALQRDSFKWFLEEGLRETFHDISPIEDFTGNLAVEFGEHEFGDPKYSVEECKEKDMSLPGASVRRRVLHQQGDRRGQGAAGLHGRLPAHDRPRHLRHQRHRARRRLASSSVRPACTTPRSATRRPTRRSTPPRSSPRAARGSSSRPTGATSSPCASTASASSRSRVLLKALGIAETPRGDPRAVRRLGVHQAHAREGLHREPRRGAHRDLQAPASRRAADGRVRARRCSTACSSTRSATTWPRSAATRSTRSSACELPDRAVDADQRGHPRRGPLPRAACGRATDGYDVDDIDHFGNRRVRIVGELIQNQFRIGLARMERVVRERMTTQDVEQITPQSAHQHPADRGRHQGVLRVQPALAVHGPDEPARRPDAQAPPLGPRPRRSVARARRLRGPRRAPEPLRPHVPDRDA